MSIEFYDENHSFGWMISKYSTTMKVVDDDTFSAAKAGDACLNFASHKRPGGGYKAVMNTRMPIKTQEEDLFRRSNLPEVMDTAEIRQQYYPLETSQGIYCKAIVSKDKHLDPIDPFEVGIITVPAVVNPQPHHANLVKAKAQRVFEIAADQGHSRLILGAWGCGVFNNDPQTIATLFNNLIKDEFQGVFEQVIFAIPGANSSNHKKATNHKIFAETVMR